jgi:hypothetical protein
MNAFIFNIEDIEIIDFTQVDEKLETLRYSLDGTKSYVKYHDRPTFFDENIHTELTYNELVEILATSEWSIDMSYTTE